MAKYECLRGWWADHHSKHGWTAVHGDPEGLPDDLVGRVIVVELGPPTKFGPMLGIYEVVEVLERTCDRVVVRDREVKELTS